MISTDMLLLPRPKCVHSVVPEQTVINTLIPALHETLWGHVTALH